MLFQSLPQSATSYTAVQREEITAAVKAINRQWARVGNDFDAGWNLIQPTLQEIMLQAQTNIVASSVAYIPAVLEETNQPMEQVAKPNAKALVGLTGSGASTDAALGLAPIRAKQSVAEGATAFLAREEAGKWLTYAAGTILSDTGRSAEGLGMSAFRSDGWVRVLSPPSCSRCAVLAGKWFRFNAGFDRHPGCDCRHLPSSEGIAGDLTMDAQAYFDSLDGVGRLKFAGSHANLRAIGDGADINQIVNAYRKTSGMDFAQVSPIKLKTNRNGTVDKFTTEGTTRRGLAGQQQTGLRRNGPAQLRLMPESIYRTAATPEDALRLLKLYGWIGDSAGRTRGRAIFADLRRVERNARAVARRAERRIL